MMYLVACVLYCGMLGRSYAEQDGITCERYDSLMGATFDLEAMVRTAGELNYIVEDGIFPCADHVEKNYTYIFNVCGTVRKGIPHACQNLPGLSVAGAVQVDNNETPSNPNDDICHVVGDYTENSFTIKLLDEKDPTRGLELAYTGGDRCQHGGMNRRFIINIVCEDRLSSRPAHIYELSHCDYTATIPTTFGCPLECPIANRAVCGGQGECAYDFDARRARCFCYQGFSGKDCNAKDTSATDLNYSPALLGLIITLFVIIGFLVGGIVLMIKQVQAFKDDMTHYQALKGEEEFAKEDVAAV